MAPDLPEPSDNRIRAILDRIPAEASVLDVGCVQHNARAADDRNWLHKHLYQRARSVRGIDVLVGDIYELQAEGYNVAYGDAEAFDHDETYDVIVAGELIEHLSAPGAFLERARRHLAADGKLIMTTPNVWGACYLKRTLLPGEVHCNEEHTCWYDRRTLRQLVERCGFAVSEQSFIEPPLGGEYLSWGLWQLGSERYGALTQLLVATPASEVTQEAET
jgi:2-polyprenyl-3-methyl-5-hydroxy-6-metoxy-1,4-benzoquinol methylase